MTTSPLPPDRLTIVLALLAGIPGAATLLTLVAGLPLDGGPLLMAAAIGLVGAVALGVLAVKRQRQQDRSVRRLIDATERLARGELSARAGSQHSDVPTDPLSASFDQMAERLQARIEALQADLATLDEARLAMATREASLRRLVTAAPDGMVSVDAQQRVTFFNPAAESIFGYRADEVVGQPLARLLPERFREVHQQAMARLAEIGTSDGPAHRMQIAALRASGEERPVEAMISRSTGEEGLRLHVTVRDVGDRVRLEDERREAERQAFETEKLHALGQMAGGIAHNLNQVLGLISGYGEMARAALLGPAADAHRALEMLGVVTNAAFTGGETVRRLLSYARPDADAPAEVVDVMALLEDVARLTAPRLGRPSDGDAERIELIVSVTERPLVRGRPNDLRDALTGLVANAIDALPLGGKIELIAEPADGQTVIAVADTGIGMSDDLRERAFEPFFTTKPERGTGLGLATVARVVEQHGGQVEIETAPGQGTTVRMLLPTVIEQALDAALAPARPGGPADGASGTRPKRVLAVDDDPALARLVGLMLEPLGHIVVTATSGEEALERLDAAPFDLVISDLSMGEGMNGWELAEQIRDRWQGVRFVLVTGWGAGLDPARARELNIESIIAKPYRVSALDALLQD